MSSIEASGYDVNVARYAYLPSLGLDIFYGINANTPQWQIDPSGHPVLSITGQIKNVSKQPQTVPSVVFAFHDEAGEELFEWATAVRINALDPGATVPFTDVVLAPADAVRNVEIRFAKLRR